MPAYIIVFLFVTILFSIEFLISLNFNSIQLNKQKTIFKFIALLIVSLFMGLRYANGWDYMQYYNTIVFHMESNIVTRGEFLNVLLIELSRSLGSPIYYFLINSFMQIFLIASTIYSYSRNFWISLFFYLSFPLFYLNSFSVIRTATALSIVFFAYRYLDKKEPIKYALAIFFASGFHTSALLALIFYPVIYLKFDRKKIVFFSISGLFLFRILNYIVSNFFPAYRVYLNQTGTIEGTKAILILLLIGIVTIVYIDDFKDKNYFKIFVVGIIIYLSFFGYGTISHRLSLYGTIFSLLIIPELIEKVMNKYRIVLIIIFVLLCWILYYYSLVLGGQTFFPYRFFFDYN